jgi:hypothetical protein
VSKLEIRANPNKFFGFKYQSGESQVQYGMAISMDEIAIITFRFGEDLDGNTEHSSG